MRRDPETPPAKIAGRKFRMTGAMTFDATTILILSNSLDGLVLFVIQRLEFDRLYMIKLCKSGNKVVLPGYSISTKVKTLFFELNLSRNLMHQCV